MELSISSLLPSLINKLNISKNEFANLINVDIRELNLYLNGRKPNQETFNKIIEVIDYHHFDFFSLFNLDDSKYLYHGSRGGIVGLVSANKNRDRGLDFGNGFYLSEFFKLAITYVDKDDDPHVYRFLKEDIISNKTYTFKKDDEGIINWTSYIGLSRNVIEDKTARNFLNERFNLLFKNYDVLIGDIADSFNFDAMKRFFSSRIDIDQARYVLLSAKLGNQYVIKKENAANKLKYVDEYTFDKNLLAYIRKWHKNVSAIEKEEMDNILDESQAKPKRIWKNILRDMINE